MYLGFPTEFCYERVSRNRDETNFVILQNKVVIPRNSGLTRNGLFRVTKRKLTKQNYAKKTKLRKKVDLKRIKEHC